MKIVAAYLLATLGGNNKPDVKAVQAILKSVEANVEDEQVEKLISSLEGKTLAEVLEAGKKQLASVPAGGSSSSGSSKVESKTVEKKAEKKVEEEKKKSEEESGGDIGFGLFGGEEE
jgi:large subunit ribosomal protein LP2